MKIYILYEFRDGPYGGVNQFLKALRDTLTTMGHCTDELREADVILFNSSNATKEVIAAKRKYPEKLFIERVDGPTRLYNNMQDKRDLIANLMNRSIADALVFQTEFSREANYRMGMKKNKNETIIMNAPNGSIFNPSHRKSFSRDGKITLIASSWSANRNKGFDVYQYLDETLDFNRFEMIFIGNSPLVFRNIKIVEPLPSNKLADSLRNADIYITASKKEACSNALIEALCCGLPAIAYNDGGNPEIIGDMGVLFEKKEEIPCLLDEIIDHYEMYAGSIRLQTIEEVARNYYQFAVDLHRKVQQKEYNPKRFNFFSFLKLKTVLFLFRLQDKLLRTIKRNGKNE